MLVVGFNCADNFTFSRNLDVDPDSDSPRKIHDLLSKESGSTEFNTVICIENDEIVAHFSEGEDYDLTDSEEDDSVDSSDDEEEDDINPDHLTEDESDDFNEED